MKSAVLRANILGEKHKERKDSRESPMKYAIQEAKIIFFNAYRKVSGFKINSPQVQVWKVRLRAVL